MSKNFVTINEKIKNFRKKINIDGDKSLSIRWALIASQSIGVSKAKNLLKSEDVKNTLNCLKKLGVKINEHKNFCTVEGRGLNGFIFRKNLILNAGNSGTLGRLILSLLIKSPYKIKIIGDKSLSKRDFKRVSDPLTKFGAKFILSKNQYLPIKIFGTSDLKPINYFEKKGSAQCKSSVIFGGIRTKGKTIIRAKKSRNHTELLFKHMRLPLRVISKKNFDEITIEQVKRISPLKYNIPSDISSSAFFIALTVLTNNSQLIIKNVNVNPSRIGIITILKKMGVKIILKNQRIYNGEKIADIKVRSPQSIKPINCPSKLNSGTIDEFLIIFIIAAKAKGVSFFKKLSELNHKESPRLDWGKYILKQMGVKIKSTKDSIKIFGNPNLKINKKIVIKNYLKDHRVFMASTIAALTFGGMWKIYDKDSIKTSFPNFLKIINKIKNSN